MTKTGLIQFFIVVAKVSFIFILLLQHNKCIIIDNILECIIYKEYK